MKNAFVQAEKFPYNNLRFWVSIRVYFQVLFENDVNENYYYTLSELAKLIYYSIHLLFFCFVKWTCQIMPIFQSVFAPFLKTEISIDHLNRINVFYNAVFMTVKQVYQIRLIPADYIRTRYLEMIRASYRGCPEAAEAWGRPLPNIVWCGGKSSFCPHNIFPRDLNIKKLKRQLQMLPNDLWNVNHRPNGAREIFSEVDKHVRIYMTIPPLRQRQQKGRSLDFVASKCIFAPAPMTEDLTIWCFFTRTKTFLTISIFLTSLSSLFL